MNKARTLTLNRNDNLSSVSAFFDREIGLNAYLIRDIKAESINNNSTKLTVVYSEYPDDIVDSIAPRKGGIYTSDIFSSDFDARILFNYPIDPGSIEDGSFIVDGSGLLTSQVKVPSDLNGYFVQLDISDFSSESFHEFRIDSSKIKRLDNTNLPYSPVGGYILHKQSSAHLGEERTPILDRRRGVVRIDVTRTSKGGSVEQVLSEALAVKGIDENSLIRYVTVSRLDNTLDVYYIYISKQEPQIIEGFPLSNFLFPDASAPNYVTLVFSTELDSLDITNENRFSIESDFNTSTSISPSDIELLSDNRTVRIDISSYVTTKAVYSIIARPGIRAANGLRKEKPEQWVLHADAYEGGATGSGISPLPTGGLELVDGEIGIIPGPGFLMPGSPGDPISINPGSGLEPPVDPGDPFHVALDYDTIQIDGSGNLYVDSITESKISDLQDYTLQIDFTGHTGIDTIHYTQDQISITESQISDLKDYTLQIDFTGHIGQDSIHFTKSSIDHHDLAGLTDDDHTQYVPTDATRGFTAEVSGKEPIEDYHLTTKQYVDDRVVSASSGVSEAEFADHTGDTTIHFTESSIDHTSIQNIGTYTHSQIDTHLDNSSIHFTEASISITESQISDLKDYALSVDFTGHTGDSSIHFTEGSIDHTAIQNVGSNTHSQIDTHIANSNIHFTEGSIDHGSIVGLTDDDHTQYSRVDGARDYTSTVGGVTPVASSDFTTKGYVDSEITGATGDLNLVSEISDLSDVDTAGVVLNDMLEWDGSNWVPTPPPVQPADLKNFISYAESDTSGAKILTGESGIYIDTGRADFVYVGATFFDDFNSHTGDSTTHFTESSIDHTQIQNIGTLTHSQLDDHVENESNPHSVTANQVGAAGIADFTGHTGDSNIHFTEASIDHANIQNIGSNTHAQIDSHISDFNNPHGVTLEDLGAASEEDVEAHTGDSTIHFTESSIDHTQIQNIGSNTHAQIDSHISDTDIHYSQASISITESQISDLKDYTLNSDFTGHTGDSTIHFTESSIDHTNIQNVGSNTHAQIDSHISDFSNPHGVTVSQIGAASAEDFISHTGDSSIHFTEASIDHTNLQNIGTNTHAQIDSHLASISNPHSVTAAQVGSPTLADFTGHTGDSSVHFTEASIDHTNILNVGSNTHSQIDSHIADSTLHFTEGSIDHTAIQNVGSNTHAQIDGHIASTSNPHSVTAAQVGSPTLADFTGHTGDGSIHFTQGEISITESQVSDLQDYALQTDLDSHSGDSTIHFTESSIDHTNLQNIGTNTHSQIDTHIANSDIHFTQSSIDHTLLENIGSNTHAQIDTHIASTSNPHSVTASDVGSPTIADFTGHTGDSSIHFTQGEISITESQISDLGDYVLSSTFDSHTGDTSIHFTESSIDHTNILNVGSNTHAQIDSHISDSSIHFTEASINITESQISDLQDYALDSEFTEHTGDGSIHFTQGEISITESQISDFGTYVSQSDLDSLSGDFTGHTGDSTVHFTESSIDHTNIQNIGSNTHAQIDSHIGSSSNPHSVTAAQVGAVDNAEFTGHTGDSSIHFTEGEIDHTNILNVGSNTHSQIDSHISDSSIHFTEASISITESQISDLQDYTLDSDFTNHTGNSSIHFTESSIDHTNIQNVGTNTHSQIDSHISDSSIHFTQASISITESQISDLGDYALDSDFTSHTGDGTIHFTQGEISITESQISDLGNYLEQSALDGLSGDFTGHTGDSTIHFTESSIDHTQIQNIGTNTHAQIDSHIADTSNPHSVTAAQVGAADEAVLTGHTGDSTIHFTEASISHLNIQDIGTNSHSDIDNHISDSTLHFTEASISITESQISDLQDYAISSDFTGHTGDSTIHFTEGSIDHTSIQNVGSNTHAQIDSHISNSSIHFTEASISITESQISDLKDYALESDLTGHTGQSDIHFTESSIDHTNIQNIGTNTHAQIDSHLASTSNPHSVTASQVGAADATDFDNHTGDSSIHFTESSIDHDNIQSAGINTHAAIDGHLASSSNPHNVSASQVGAPTEADFTGHTGDSSIHFLKSDIELDDLSDVGGGEAGALDGQIIRYSLGADLWEYVSFDHGNMNGLSDDDHTQYVLADGSRSMTSNWDIGSVKITNMSDPTAAQDAATAGYVLTTALLQVQNLADLDNASTARTNLGLGDSATRDVGTASGEVPDTKDVRFMFPSMSQFDWWESGFLNGNTVSSGDSTAFMQNPQFGDSDEQSNKVTAVFNLDGGTTTSGTQAVARYFNQRVFLANNRVFRLQFRTNSSGGILNYRIGLSGNSSVPSASGAPSDGVWVEYDSATSANIMLTTGNSSTYTQTTTSTTGTHSSYATFDIVFESTSSVKLYLVSGGTSTLIATNTTNIPNTDALRTGYLFYQLEKDTSNATRGQIRVLPINMAVDRQSFVEPITE